MPMNHAHGPAGRHVVRTEPGGATRRTGAHRHAPPDGTGAPDHDERAALLRCLADATRLRIVEHLMLGEHRVVDLTEHLGLAQSTVSQHLACLRECGVAVSVARGRASVWGLVAKHEVARLLDAADDVRRVL